MGNKESSNKEAIAKLKEYQREKGAANIERYYTQQQLNMAMPGSMGNQAGNPWDLQQRFQDKPHVALPEAKAIQGIKNELYIDKASLKLVPQGAGKFGLRFSFYSLTSECVVAVYQGCLEMVTGLPANDPNYSPANPIRINFVPLKNSKFD